MIRVLTRKETAQYMRISLSSLERAIASGRFVPRILLSPNRIGFLEADIMEWLESRKIKAEEQMEAVAH